MAPPAGRSGEGRADKAGLSAGRAGERKRGGCRRRGAEQVRREPGLCHAGTGSGGRAPGRGPASRGSGGAGAAPGAPGGERDRSEPFTAGSSGRGAVMAGALIHPLPVGPKVLWDSREEITAPRS